MLGIVDATRENVYAYVNNSGHEERHRRGLLQAWNRNQTVHRIPTPEDLAPTEAPVVSGGFNFLQQGDDAYDSSDDENLNLPSFIRNNTSRTVTIHRSSTGNTVETPVLPLDVVIRVGRQAVRHDQISTYFDQPVATELSGNIVEFTAPRGNDIVAFRMNPNASGDTYSRPGGVNPWSTIANELQREIKDSKQPKEEQARKRRRLSGAFKGNIGLNTPTEAEAVGAMACDFMKGSGNRDYVEKLEKADDDSTPDNWFKCEKMLYGPAGEGGRSLATDATKKYKTKEYREKRKQLRAKKASGGSKDASASSGGEGFKFIPPVPDMIEGRRIHNVVGDNMDCLIRSMLYSALGNIDESTVTICRNHLVEQGVTAPGKMLDLARAAGAMLVAFLEFQAILDAKRGIVVYVPGDFGPVPIDIYPGPNPILLWLSEEHFRAIR